MCLAACYWARIERVVHAADLVDAAEYGFEDEAFYRQLGLPKRDRSLRVEDAGRPWHSEAVAAFAFWCRAVR
jgi:guanine deaminase